MNNSVQDSSKGRLRARAHLLVLIEQIKQEHANGDLVVQTPGEAKDHLAERLNDWHKARGQSLYLRRPKGPHF
jgi:hypothetical protein